MSLPQPDTPLGDHCSTLFDGTLYTFSSAAFQSLSLSKGAEWKTLPAGVGTTGAECVHAHKNTPQEALYIVGGTTSNSSTVPETGFMGLQRWLFNDKKWETIGLPAAVTYNLTNHGATFLESSQQIIVFSGTIWPDTTTPSANTFLIGTTAPFEITSIPAADPLLAPLVLPWGDDGALVVGGNENNRGLKVYSPTTGWNPLPMSLGKGLPVKGKAGASLMNGDDGSRMLYTFDLTTGPTVVSQLLVKDPKTTGLRRRQETAASPTASPSTSSTPLTAPTWPTYDSKLAPKLTMEGISVAFDGDMVVISPADNVNPMVIFDARKNSWENTTEIFGITNDDESISTLDVNTSNIPTSTSSEVNSASSSSAAAAATSSPRGLSTVKLLAAVLGSILGLVFILAVLLFYLRRRRKQREQGGQGARRMSFQDRGTSFMQETGNLALPHAPRAAVDSWASKDTEKYGQPGSSTYNVDKNGPIITTFGGVGVIVTGDSTPIPPPGDRSIPTRSSGWSKYFSDAEATNLVTLPQRSYSETRSAHSSTYTDLSISFPAPGTHTREGQVHTNPYLHNAGSGVAAGGIGIAPATGTDPTASGGLQRSGSKGLMLQDPGVGVHSPSGQRRESKTISLGRSSYSSGVPESLIDGDRTLSGGWSPVDESYSWEGRGTASSIYPDNPDVLVQGLDLSRNRVSGPQFKAGQSVDNLSWLNLRQ